MRKWFSLFRHPAVVAVTLVAAAAAGLCAWPGLAPQSLLARRLESQLIEADDNRALEMLDEATALGEPGLGVIVRSLASPRPAVAQGARQVLAAQLDQWRLWRLKYSTSKVVALAQTLAREMPQLSPAAQEYAADVATQLLLWPLDHRYADAIRVVPCCEAVLRGASSSRLAAKAAERADVAAAQRNSAAAASWPAIEAPDDLPGGGLPIEVTQMPGLVPAGTATLPAAEEPTAAPRRLTLDHQQEAAALDPAERAFGEPGRFEPPLARRVPPRGGPELWEDSSREAGQPSLRQLSYTVPEADLTQQGIQGLILSLRSESQPWKDAVRGELSRRGFSAAHLALAERLADPNPAVRRELAEALPRIPDIQAVDWLKLLAEDEDAQVRLAAFSVLASSGDAQIGRWLRQRLLHEPNADVAERLERALSKSR